LLDQSLSVRFSKTVASSQADLPSFKKRPGFPEQVTGGFFLNSLSQDLVLT